MTYHQELPKKISAFTLIEMMIVLGIVSVLFLMVRTSFQSPNIYKSESYNCVQYAHSFMQSFLYAGLTQKGLEENGTLIFPQEYNITIDPSQQNITLNYDGNEYDTFVLSGSIQQGCSNNNYHVAMTGQSHTLHIQNGNMTADTFTGYNNFLFCPKDEDCQPLGAISFDTRTQQVHKHQCNTDITTFCP